MPEFFPHHVPDTASGFTKGYFAAAEWMLDEEVNRSKIRGWAAKTRTSIEKVCENFELRYESDLALYYQLYEPRSQECAGHDFYLSRNGHGSGFRDRGENPVFARLHVHSWIMGTTNYEVVGGWIVS